MQVTATYENGDTQLLFSQAPAANTALLLFLHDDNYFDITRNQNICGQTVTCEEVPDGESSGGQKIAHDPGGP